MKRLFPAIVAISALAVLHGQRAVAQRAHYRLQGDIRGLGNDSIILHAEYNDAQGKTHLDTIAAKADHDRFALEGYVNQPSHVYAQLGGYRGRRNFSFFLEKGNISIRGSIDSTEYIRITGTPNNDDAMRLTDRTNPIYANIRALYAKAKEAGDDKATANKLERQADQLRDSVTQEWVRFIKGDPNSLVSGIYLYVASDRIPVAELDALYNSLGAEVKRTDFVQRVAERLPAKKRTLIGMPAPLFESKDMNGATVKLADYRGKYVLLDFWASWCVPCRAETPYLVKAYDKYKDKGFVILSVSTDDNKEKWLAAVAKDHMAWTNLSDLKGFTNELAQLYGVQPIPDNFLIDPSGTIIARGLRGEEVEKKLAESIQ